MKAQTTLILMVFVLIIFVGMIVVLLSFAKTISPLEYLNIYTHDLLVSVLRADVPDCPECWKDVNCKTVADLLKCSMKSPGRICGASGQSCQGLANSKIPELFKKYEQVKNWSWLILATAEGFSPAGGAYQFIPSDVEASNDKDMQLLVNWTKWTMGLPGKPSRAPRLDVLTATELITVSPGSFLKVMLVVKKKSESS